MENDGVFSVQMSRYYREKHEPKIKDFPDNPMAFGERFSEEEERELMRIFLSQHDELVKLATQKDLDCAFQ